MITSYFRSCRINQKMKVSKFSEFNFWIRREKSTCTKEKMFFLSSTRSDLARSSPPSVEWYWSPLNDIELLKLQKKRFFQIFFSDPLMKENFGRNFEESDLKKDWEDNYSSWITDQAWQLSFIWHGILGRRKIFKFFWILFSDKH